MEDRVSEPEEFGWCVLELMGHRKLAGRVSDDEGLLRVDVYDGDPDDASLLGGEPVKPLATQWYGRQAIYCITATTKENCIGLTQRYKPAPIGRYELPPATTDEHDVEWGDADVEDTDEVGY
jgi:hypothetical protein